MSRDLPEALTRHLESGATALCHCWQLERHDGQIFGFTDHDTELFFAQTVFAPQSGFVSGAIESSTGLSVDSSEAVGALSSDCITESDIQAGAYDDASVTLWLVNWNDPAQRTVLFRGSIGEVTHGPLGFRAELRGLAHRLNQPVGRAYLSRCDAQLGSFRCGVDVSDSAYSADVAIEAIGSVLTLDSLAGFADGWFTGGTLQLTSGDHAGATFRLRSHRGNEVTMWLPAPSGLKAGDSACITAGCDKRFATCKEKFFNGLNFQGFPYMPGDDWIISHPAEGEANDGSSRYR